MASGITASEIADKVELVGSWGLRLKDGYALGSGAFSELPPASENYRNLDAVVPGGDGVADQKYYCRKNADDTYEWIPVGVNANTIILAHLSSIDETSNPQTLPATDPHAAIGALHLGTFTQARMRAVVADGTAGVTATLQYTANFDPFTTFLTNTLDLSLPEQTTDWEDIPAGALGSDKFIWLRLAIAGEGTSTSTADVYLDLRG